ncbi:MAG TPA: site-specific integrase [Burkholderiales bacterium]|nr:site-specific integrase [Burkholderiales bacterium]
MTRQAITPLRKRMIEDMEIRRLAAGTQAQYLSVVARFARHFGRSPDQLGYEEVRAYQLHLAQSGLDAGSVNRATTALRFFYCVTMGWRDAPERIPRARTAEKMRGVLTPDEIARMIDAAPGAKYRAALSVAYGAGLRSSEVIALKVSDIDSARMVIRIEDGKGRRDRYAKLSPKLLAELRAWWRRAKPRVFLFPSRMSAFDHISTRQFSRACQTAAATAKLGKSVHPHMLRHSFATHLLDAGVDIRVIQAMLGHKKLETTAIYARVSPKLIQDAAGPFEQLQFRDRTAPA